MSIYDKYKKIDNSVPYIMTIEELQDKVRDKGQPLNLSFWNKGGECDETFYFRTEVMKNLCFVVEEHVAPVWCKISKTFERRPIWYDVYQVDSDFKECWGLTSRQFDTYEDALDFAKKKRRRKYNADRSKKREAELWSKLAKGLKKAKGN